jgi:antitoxin VapB
MIRRGGPIRAFTDLESDPMSESVKRESKAKDIAKIFMHGRSQAVRLPKEYRFEGNEVLVSKVGNKVILEPLRKEPIDVEALWAELDALGARDFLPDGLPDDPPLMPDEDISFD